MSLTVQALSSGNALRLFIVPPLGAVTWRVLRKPGAGQTFTGPADTGAMLLIDRSTDSTPLDLWQLRLAVNRILIANLEVFDAVGFVQVTFRASESEDLVSQNAPLFMTSFAFSCLNPALVAEPPFVGGLFAPVIVSTPQD